LALQADHFVLAGLRELVVPALHERVLQSLVASVVGRPEATSKLQLQSRSLFLREEKRAEQHSRSPDTYGVQTMMSFDDRLGRLAALDEDGVSAILRT
jgi:hypothetical protein